MNEDLEESIELLPNLKYFGKKDKFNGNLTKEKKKLTKEALLKYSPL